MVHPLISFICIAPSHEQIHEHTKYFKQKTTPRTLRSKNTNSYKTFDQFMRGFQGDGEII